jgi:outer membrane protein assembly factor BamB
MDTGLLETFPKDGPKVVWKKPLNPGYSGPAIAGGKVYVCDRIAGAVENDKPQPKGGIPGKERVLCLDFKTGEKVWEHVYDCLYERVSFPSGPRTTPVVDGNRVYTLGAMGDIFCLDATTGKPVWTLNLRKEFSTKAPVWGFAAHLLADKERLYTLVGGPDSAVVALDKATGKTVWKALTSQEVGYSPPVLVEAGGVTQLVVWLSDEVAGLNPKTGEVYWKEKHPAVGMKQMRPAVTITTPCVHDGVVYVSSAYDGALAIKLASDKPTASVLWRAEKNYPKTPEKLPTLMSTLLVKDGYLYGIGAEDGDVICAKADSGETVWTNLGLFGGKKALFGSAFWVEAEGRQYCFTDQGDLVVLDLNPKGYKELGRAHVIDPSQGARGRKVVWAHPGCSDKCMVVRNDKEIVCVSLAKE